MNLKDVFPDAVVHRLAPAGYIETMLSPPILIQPTGLVQPWTFAGQYPSLEELHAAVDGYIEIVRIPHLEHLMVVNEEGWLKEHPLPNMVATLIAGQSIAGPALVMVRGLLERGE